MVAAYPGAEGHHPANDQRKWSQSYYFNFYDPRTAVGGFMRIGLLENLKQSNMFFILFKDGKPAYTRICGVAPYTSDRMDGGVEVAGLRFTAIEPLQKALIEFADDDFSLKLTFDSLVPPGDAIAVSHSETGVLSHSIASAHLEGPGRVTGTLRLRETLIDVDGTGFRDLGWGIRDWDALYRYRLAWPLFDNGLAFAGVHVTTLDGQNAYLKMFHDGEAWRPVGELEDNVEFAADGMTVQSLRWRFQDNLGRTREFTGKPIFRAFIPFDGVMLTEQMLEYRLDDGTTGYGVCECGFRLS